MLRNQKLPSAWYDTVAVYRQVSGKGFELHATCVPLNFRIEKVHLSEKWDGKIPLFSRSQQVAIQSEEILFLA